MNPLHSTGGDVGSVSQRPRRHETVEDVAAAVNQSAASERSSPPAAVQTAVGCVAASGVVEGHPEERAHETCFSMVLRIYPDRERHQICL